MSPHRDSARDNSSASAPQALVEALNNLPTAVQEALKQHEFSREHFLDLAARRDDLDGQLQGAIQPLNAADLVDLPARGTDAHAALVRIGEDALRSGACALVVLAGGMATRMGGVVKALVEALPEKTFLELRLAEQDALTKKYGECPPLWLMTSHPTHAATTEALGERLDGYRVACFRQGLSVRLTEEGQLFQTKDGTPSLYSPGHGDLPDALKQSGLLDRFVQGGGRYVLVTNLDNLGGGLDPALIGLHLSGSAAVTCEVVNKEGTDRGGIPARVGDRPVIVEEFRLPADFDPQTVKVFNVNSFAFDAKSLAELNLDWTFFRVQKTVEERIAVQFERLINEVTFQLETRYVRVPRHGAESRFLPIKSFEELSSRSEELRLLAAARGML